MLHLRSDYYSVLKHNLNKIYPTELEIFYINKLTYNLILLILINILSIYKEFIIN